MSHDTLAGLLPWLLVPSTLAVLLTLGGVLRDSLASRTRTGSPVVPPGWTRTVTRTRRGGVVVRLHRQPTPDRPPSSSPS